MAVVVLRAKGNRLSDLRPLVPELLSVQTAILPGQIVPVGRVADRQWSNIIGILAAHTDMDVAYLNEWATSLGLDELLARALVEGGTAS